MERAFKVLCIRIFLFRQCGVRHKIDSQFPVAASDDPMMHMTLLVLCLHPEARFGCQTARVQITATPLTNAAGTDSARLISMEGPRGGEGCCFHTSSPRSALAHPTNAVSATDYHHFERSRTYE